MTGISINTTCIICDRSNPEVLEGSSGGFQVLKCLFCGFVYVYPLPPDEMLQSAYSNDYYAPWIDEQRKRRILMWKKRLDTLNNLSIRKGRLLDVGCGEGLFLHLAQKDGWETKGIEISSHAVSYGRENFGLDIIKGELPEAGFPADTFDAVTMWHVLEHTVNPYVVLKETRRVIKDDGVFILAVPNLNNIISQKAYRIIKGKRMHLFDIKDRELHLYHFNVETIKMILERTGFRVHKIIPDMGIIQIPHKVLNHIAKVVGGFIGRIVTDAIEVHAKPDY